MLLQSLKYYREPHGTSGEFDHCVVSLRARCVCFCQFSLATIFTIGCMSRVDDALRETDRLLTNITEQNFEFFRIFILVLFSF